MNGVATVNTQPPTTPLTRTLLVNRMRIVPRRPHHPSGLAGLVGFISLLGLMAFTATPAVAAPTVSLTAPAANTVYAAPASVTLTATATPSTGTTISKVEFYQGTTLIDTDTATPYSVSWASIPAGTYSLTAKATDGQGATRTSAARQLTVLAPAQQKLYFLHTDHLNTPRLVTDETKKVVWRNSPLTEPFGMSPVEEDPDGDGNNFTLNLRFPGQYADKETNTNYNYFRDYNPLTGRYLQSDPIGLQGGINTYGYVGGNPLSYTDPTGEAALPILIVGGVLGVGAAISSPQGQKTIGGALTGTINAVKDFCQPDSDCQEIQRKIDRAIAELRVRYIAMTADKERTFWNNMFGRLGWYNHQEKYREWQRNLERNVERARAMNCPYNPEADEWPNRAPPASPAY